MTNYQKNYIESNILGLTEEDVERISNSAEDMAMACAISWEKSVLAIRAAIAQFSKPYSDVAKGIFEALFPVLKVAYENMVEFLTFGKESGAERARRRNYFITHGKHGRKRPR